MILDQEQRANLRQLFDYDKTNVFELFINKLQDKIRRQPTTGPSEWETIFASISRQSQIDCLSQLLEIMNDEMSEQEVEDA